MKVQLGLLLIASVAAVGGILHANSITYGWTFVGIAVAVMCLSIAYGRLARTLPDWYWGTVVMTCLILVFIGVLALIFPCEYASQCGW
jgi:hypothetical protein